MSQGVLSNDNMPSGTARNYNAMRGIYKILQPNNSMDDLASFFGIN